MPWLTLLANVLKATGESAPHRQQLCHESLPQQQRVHSPICPSYRTRDTLKEDCRHGTPASGSARWLTKPAWHDAAAPRPLPPRQVRLASRSTQHACTKDGTGTGTYPQKKLWLLRGLNQDFLGSSSAANGSPFHIAQVKLFAHTRCLYLTIISHHCNLTTYN